LRSGRESDRSGSAVTPARPLPLLAAQPDVIALVEQEGDAALSDVIAAVADDAFDRVGVDVEPDYLLAVAVREVVRAEQDGLGLAFPVVEPVDARFLVVGLGE